MKKIFKFSLDAGNNYALPIDAAPPAEGTLTVKAILCIVLEMPAGAVVTSAAGTKKAPVMWALCDPAAKPEPRYFIVAKTGLELPDEVMDGQHVATIAYTLDGKNVVEHILELPPQVKGRLIKHPKA